VDDAEKLIKHLNSSMGQGFTLTPKAMIAIGDLLQCRKSVTEEQTWGIKPAMDVNELERMNRNRSPDMKIAQQYKVVANAQFFHPKYMIATGLTKEEAEALIKLL
jgi:hypothetical protein